MKEEWDSYMVVSKTYCRQWEHITGDVKLANKLALAHGPGYEVVPIRIKRRRWLKSESRT